MKERKNSPLSFSNEGLLLLIVLVLLLGSVLGAWRVREVDEFLREELLQNAQILAETIDVRDVRLLSGNERDLGTPQYERFKEYFQTVIRLFPESRFLTLVGRHYDGRIFFYVDSEPPGSEDESPPGEVYDAVDPAFLPVFDEGISVVVGPVVDQWGTWISAWVPLREFGSERVLAALALDISGDEWQRRLDKAKVLPALISLLLSGLLLAGRVLLKRRESLNEEGRRRYRHLEVSVMLLFGLVATTGAVWIVHERERHAYSRAFSVIAEARSVNMNYMVGGLRHFALEGAARFIESLETVEYGVFRVFAQHLSSRPEIEAVMWSPRVTSGEREAFESAYRQEWRTCLEIRDRDATGRSVRAAERPMYYPVLFRSPMTGRDLPVGSDLFDRPELRAAIEKAERTKMPAVAFMELERGRERHIGLWLCRPLFARSLGSPVKGVVSVLVQLDLFPYVVTEESDGMITMKLLRLSLDAPPVELASSEGKPHRDSVYRFVRPFSIFGETMAAELYASEAFQRFHPARGALLAGITGVLMTLTLASFIAFSVNRQEILEKQVSQRTEELRRSEGKHRMASQIYRSLSEGIVVTDPEGYILDGNNALETLTGYSLEEIRGRRPSMFSAQKRLGEDSVRFWEYLRTYGTWQGETWNRRKDGEAYPVWLTVNAVTDENGEITHYAGVLTHIGDIKSEQQRLSHLAYHDSLTGLPNRLLLTDRLDMALARARREQTMVAVLFMDLDGFKEINDRYGHEKGDVLLAAVARRLSGAIREQDTVARFGGDEFVLVFDGLLSSEEANELFRKTEALFEEPFTVDRHSIFCGASIGMAVHPRDGESARELITRADERMYDRKARARPRLKGSGEQDGPGV